MKHKRTKPSEPNEYDLGGFSLVVGVAIMSEQFREIHSEIHSE